jgi:hypothetical protein
MTPYPLPASQRSAHRHPGYGEVRTGSSTIHVSASFKQAMQEMFPYQHLNLLNTITTGLHEFKKNGLFQIDLIIYHHRNILRHSHYGKEILHNRYELSAKEKVQWDLTDRTRSRAAI